MLARFGRCLLISVDMSAHLMEQLVHLLWHAGTERSLHWISLLLALQESGRNLLLHLLQTLL